MKTSNLVSMVFAPRLWIACAAMVALGAVGCGDSDSGSKKDASAAGGSTAKGGSGGAGGTGGMRDAALDGPGGSGGVRIDGAAGSGGRIDGGGIDVGAGGTGGRIDGGGGGGIDAIAIDGRRSDGPVDRPRDVPLPIDTPDAAGIDGASNCGASGQACCPGSTCSNGGCCVAVGGGDLECVAQGDSCGSRVGGVCTAGGCASEGGICGTAGGECCLRSSGIGSGGTSFCGAGNLTCARADGSTTCMACGGLGEPCCGITDNRTCTAANTACVGATNSNPGTCEACGALNGPCCANDTCASATNVCEDDECVACGGEGQPCCADEVCTGNLECQGRRNPTCEEP